MASGGARIASPFPVLQDWGPQHLEVVRGLLTDPAGARATLAWPCAHHRSMFQYIEYPISCCMQISLCRPASRHRLKTSDYNQILAYCNVGRNVAVYLHAATYIVRILRTFLGSQYVHAATYSDIGRPR